MERGLSGFPSPDEEGIVRFIPLLMERGLSGLSLS
jgi:hypothetical protein